MRTNCSWYNYVAWGYVGTTLCTSGILLSAAALYSFAGQKRHTSHASTLVLQSLAAVDILLLGSVLITDCVPYICEYTRACVSPWTAWPYVRYIWLLTPYSHLASVWLITLIACNRYYAVCRPHRLDAAWTVVRTRTMVVVVLVIAGVYNLPRLFEYRIAEGYDECSNQTLLMELGTEFSRRGSYRLGYKAILTSTVLIALPLLLQVALTVLTIKRLSTKRGPKSTPTTATAGVVKKSSPDNRITDVTLMLLVVVLVAIICQLPLGVFHIVRAIVVDRTSRSCNQALYWLDTLSKLAVNANPTLNFAVYMSLSPPFRHALPFIGYLKTVTSKYVMRSEVKYRIEHDGYRGKPLTNSVVDTTRPRVEGQTVPHVPALNGTYTRELSDKDISRTEVC